MASVTTTNEVYWDPYDEDLLADPYPAFRRLREDAPLYRNEDYDFWAVSRFDDVEQVLLDKVRFLNRYGTNLEKVIKADSRDACRHADLWTNRPSTPRGSHSCCRGCSPPRAMTRRSSPMVPSVYCVPSARSARGRRSAFDVVEELEPPRADERVFGMLLGIPEEEQEAIRDHIEESMKVRTRRPPAHVHHGWESGLLPPLVEPPDAQPRRRRHHASGHTEFDDETGIPSHLHPRRGPDVPQRRRRRGNHTTNRLIGWTVKVLADNPDARRETWRPLARAHAIEETLRYEPSSTQIARSRHTHVEIHGQTVPRAAPCSASSVRRTVTSDCSRTRTPSTSTARSAITSPSGTAPTSASARRWPGWRGAWPSRRCSSGSATGRSTSDRARLTGNVAGRCAGVLALPVSIP